MHLFYLRRTWNLLARKDPLWAVLTDPDKSGQRWKLDQFFTTGEQEIATKLAAIRRHNPALRTGQALDFGCGVGRLSQALAGHFDQVTGIDISEDMLAHARRHNRHGARVNYVHNARPDLRALASDRFDLVCSIITLQHMKPALARAYLAEFVRVCAPGGIIFFQLPEPHPAYDSLERLRFSWWPPTLWKRLKRVGGQRLKKHVPLWPVMEMHGIPHEEVSTLVENLGARLLCSQPHQATGEALPGFDYIVLKPSSRSPVTPPA